MERERKQAGAQTKLVTEVDAACAWTWVRDWGGQGAWHHILDRWGRRVLCVCLRSKFQSPRSWVSGCGCRYPWDLSP